MKCKKVRYHDHEQAVSAIQKIKNAPTEGEKPTRAYHCEDCNGWHLTKKAMVSDGIRRTNLKFFDVWRGLCQL